MGGILAFTGTAIAGPVIDFNIAPGTGLISYAGGITPLMGTNIGIESITGANTPANAGTFECIDCVLTFTTGNFNPLLTAASPANDWVFEGALGTSTLTIFGAVNTDGDPEPEIGPSILMLGSFFLPQFSVDLRPNDPTAAGFSTGLLLDIKNPAIVEFFGLTPEPILGGFFVTWAGIGEPPSPFAVVPLGGQIRNNFVPEPGATFVLAAGLLGLAAIRSFRRRP